MEAPSVAKRVLVTILAVAMLLLSGTMAWAVAEDMNSSDVVPQGVRLLRPGAPPIVISGLTRSELTSRIQTALADPFLQPVNVRYQKRNFVLNVRQRGLVRVNVQAMIDEAFRTRDNTTLASRVVQTLTGTTQTVDVKPLYSVDAVRLRTWVGVTIARTIEKKAVDAQRSVVGNKIVIKPSVTGLQVDRTATANRIKTAIIYSRTVPKTVPVVSKVLKPKVNESSFGRTIVVDKSERRLYLYNGAKLQKSYRVAVGMPGYPTPLGQFSIVAKRYMPAWSNPGSAWAADMPDYIPPGPGNPLGTRAMNLSASGIRIHGTNKISSIGTAASHGCIRMLRHDVEQLYDLVKVGTVVFVVP